MACPTGARRTSMQAEPEFRKDFIPELDGLRGIAVLLVLWVHLPAAALGERMAEVRSAMLPGNVGVDLFFVLSGFLITRILLVDRARDVPLRYFLARRFVRIFPIYYLSIAVLWGQLGGWERAACLTYTSNYAFLFKSTTSVLEHTWSLAVEEHFYILWPPAVAFLSPRTSRRILLLVVLPLGLASVLGVLLFGDWAHHGERLTEYVLRSSNVKFLSLGAGALLAYHERAIRSRPRLALGVFTVLVALSLSLSLNGLRALGLIDGLRAIDATGGREQWFMFPVRAIATPLGSLGAVVLGVAWTGNRWPHGRLLRSRLLRSCGRISYGVYLYHFPLFITPGIWGADRAHPTPARVALVLALCFVVATLSYISVERPMLDLGARFRVPATGERTALPLEHGPASRPRVVTLLRALAFVCALAWLLHGGAVRLMTMLAP